MTTWEYCDLLSGGGRIRLSPANKFDEKDLAKIFPNGKVKRSKDNEILIEPKIDDGRSRELILDYLGSNGWEAYAYYTSVYFLKRQK